MSGPGPIGESRETILRRERRQRQTVRRIQQGRQNSRASVKRDGTTKPEVELSASPLRLSSGPSDVKSPVLRCTMEAEEQVVVRRAGLTPSLTPSSILSQEQSVPSKGAASSPVTTGQGAAPNKQPEKKEGPPNVWFEACDVRLKEKFKKAAADVKK